MQFLSQATDKGVARGREQQADEDEEEEDGNVDESEDDIRNSAAARSRQGSNISDLIK